MINLNFPFSLQMAVRKVWGKERERKPDLSVSSHQVFSILVCRMEGKVNSRTKGLPCLRQPSKIRWGERQREEEELKAASEKFSKHCWPSFIRFKGSIQVSPTTTTNKRGSDLNRKAGQVQSLNGVSLLVFRAPALQRKQWPNS